MEFKNYTKGFFVVSGSNLIRLGDIYRATIFSYGYDKKEKILIRIRPSDKEKKANFPYQKVALLGTEVQTIDIDASKFPEDNYVLEVKTASGETFKAQKALHMNTKKHSVFVQTDKSMYKPGDNIQFRVLALDAQMKPLNNAAIEIFISDGADNRVKQFDEPKFNKGVFQNELQLSDLPIMGTWKIHVKINGEEALAKAFDVAEYVLPKFEVSIDSNPDITFKDGKIRATVKANYTFGKIAKGNASVTAEVENENRYGRRNFGWHQEPIENDAGKVVKTVEVDGKKFVEFDLKKELKIQDSSFERKVKLTASFKEELSGKEATAETFVQIHITPHKLELKKSSEKFKPGLPFSVSALLRFHDKSAPVTDADNPIKFTITTFWDVLRKYRQPESVIVAGRKLKPNEEYEIWEQQYEIKNHEIYPKNGIAKLEIDLKKNVKHFDVKAKYLNTEESLHRVEKTETESDQYIMATVLTENPVLSENVLLEILTTDEISQLSYQVIGRGITADAKSLSFEATKQYILEIKPTLMMIPKAKIVVYYLTNDGEIISDKTEIEFGNELVNKIDVSLSTEEARPGSDIDISVTTQSNSFVGLLGVDQSVLLLKKGNDIEPSMVFQELEKYGTTDKYNYDHYNTRRDDEDFREANAVIITNAKNPFSRYDSEESVKMYACSGGGGGGLLGMPKMKRMALRSAAPDIAFANRVRPMADAMMMADSPMDLEMCEALGSAPPMMIKKPIEIRKTFPETWLFDNLEFNSEDLKKTISKKVPDTITSWIITGFSINPESGLGILTKPSKFNVFQPFFVSTNLPYSIKRGEVVSIPVIIFNYTDDDQDTDVTLFNNDGDFEFVDAEISDVSSKEAKRTTPIKIKSNEGATVSFMIKPLKVGNILIKVVAESAVAGDGIERQLKVEPEGVTQFLNEAVFIDLRSKPDFSTVFEIQIPKNAVTDSTHIEIGAIGDLLGPTINNLDKLIKMPFGCGEQNMLNFVPNILILDYLTNVKSLTSAIEAKAKKYMEVGYQRELTYKHSDGSYSAFGESDKSGSTWLTAFVAKSFNQAAKYILIDDNKIKQALDFLKKVQAKDGSFPEVGYVCHTDMQGGSSKGIALTAYTLITFVENEKYRETFKETIQKALNYIIENCEQLDDNYSLALAAYALQIAQHEKKEFFLKKLEEKAELKDGLKFWQKELPKEENQNPWRCRPNSVNVEMSAYGLQALIAGNRETDGIPIMKWLVSQRNENGGFQSTQDTVVGLQALSKLASKIYSADSDIELTVKSQNANPTVINVNNANSLVLQKFEVSPSSRRFEISAKGKGFSILQVSYRYNLDESGKFPRFKIDHKVESTLSKETLNLSVGVVYIADEQTQKSNMAVMEVTLPSGFTFDADSIDELLKTARVKKVETKDGDTVVIVYFDDIDTKEIRPQVKAIRTHKVAKQKPAPIVVYDYYDNSRRATSFYSPPEISVADIARE